MTSASRMERVEARVHGRYLVRPALEDVDMPAVLVGFHGFGQSARIHMEELERLPGLEAWTLVAVEALHPFYTRAGEVVACWMTRQDRELAIEENIAYVGAVIDRVLNQAKFPPKLTTCGFSQGVAMAYRAATDSRHKVSAVVALGGDVPPELAEREALPFERVLIGRGLDEEWYGAEKLAADRELLQRLGITPEIFEYQGGHEWTEAFRRRAAEFLLAS